MNRGSIASAIVSGLLLAASFPKIDLPFLAWIALIPLLVSLRGKTLKQGFFLGGIAGIVFFSGTVFWVTNSIHFYGGIPLLPASAITLLLCAYLALYPALFGAIAVRARDRFPSLLPILLPAAWTALELARTYVFSGFPWALLGYSQYRVLPLIQFSDLTGVYGVSFAIVLVNTAIAEFIANRKKYAGLIAAACTMAIIAGYGVVRLGMQPQDAHDIRISVVQGNIEQDKKWDPAYQSEVMAVYERLTRQAIELRPDLVIWPETATPFYFGGAEERNSVRTKELLDFIRKGKTPLLFGSPTYEVNSPKQIYLRNSAFLVSGKGSIDSVYHKMHLVPFGEYVPLKSIFFFVEKMVQAVGDFRSGQAFTVMTFAGRNHEAISGSTVICYEIIFPDMVRRFVKNGAEVMTTITNDAWFGRTAAPYQHFSMAVFRAIENRTPVARAANTGISGFIDSHGKILDQSEIFEEAVLTRTVATSGKTKTFYTRWGDVFAYLCALLTLGVMVIKKF